IILKLFVDVTSLELWEIDHRYPSMEQFSLWLAARYEQSIAGLEFAINGALRVSGLPPTARTVTAALGRLTQDVDDLVNLLEVREMQFENDDLKMGMVTYPLVAALAARPGLAEDLTTLWNAYRPLAC